MNIDELSDRVQMLEDVVRLLIIHLNKDRVISARLPSELVDSLIEISTGDTGQTLQAERWQVMLEGSRARY